MKPLCNTQCAATESVSECNCSRLTQTTHKQSEKVIKRNGNSNYSGPYNIRHGDRRYRKNAKLLHIMCFPSSKTEANYELS